MKSIFLNAWKIMAILKHNKDMEWLNNPTPEITSTRNHCLLRITRLKRWSCTRWGYMAAAKIILDGQFPPSQST
jgi:hypothetical protein